MNESIRSLTNFLNGAHSAFHAQALTVKALEEAGYEKLPEGDDWNLRKGGRYFVTRGNTAVIAFRIPQGDARGFLMSAAHTDRPTFKIKENPDLCGTYTRLAVERYGGQILSTWLDRPLSIAGRVMVETENGAQAKLVDFDRDLLMIPNVAIHMNRTVNDGYKWNPVCDTIPLFGSADCKGALNEMLEQAAGGKILGHDLTLYIRQPASVWGAKEEYLSAQALDDLACVWSTLAGFLKAQDSRSIPVFCALDSEEVGSSSVQGAASTMLRDVLERICDGMKLDFKQLVSRSALVSADNGHAVHPNHPELADATNAPVLGKGVLLKFNATLKYCTDGLCAALFRTVCNRAGVDVQTYCNRADIAGGSTLGCISLGQVSVPTVDIGLPQLAMHSCFETVAVADCIALEKAMTEYFGSTLELSDGSFQLV